METLKSENTDVSLEVLAGDAVVSGIPCKSGPIAYFRGERTLAQAWLSEDFTWKGKVLPKGSIVFFSSDGVLTSVDLAAPATIAGEFFEARTLVRLGPEGAIQGSVIRFENERILLGIPCTGSAGFSVSGALELTRLARDTVIDGVPCQGGKVITFHPNGKLKSATLAKAHALRGALFPRETHVSWGEDGLARTARLSAACTVGGQEYPEGMSLSFVDGGGVAPADWQFVGPGGRGRTDL